MKKAFLLIAVLSLSALVYGQDTMMKPKTDTMTKPGDSMKAPGDAMMKADDSMMDPSAYDLKGLGPNVIAFTSEKDAKDLAKKQTVVYFFAATWCPDCQATYADIKANYMKIPANVTIVFVNYDKSPDLKKKYGVTYQHTFVVIDASGKKKKIWNGTTTVASLVMTATMK
jgi:thiol-disulfide isomerase/thioredoxin